MKLNDVFRRLLIVMDFLESVVVVCCLIGFLVMQRGDITSNWVIQEWEANTSQQEWQKWDTTLRDAMTDTMQYLESVDVDALVLSDVEQNLKVDVEQVKEFHRKAAKDTREHYRILLGRLDEARNKGVYHRYIKVFAYQYKNHVSRNGNVSERSRSTRLQLSLFEVDRFLNNIEYADKIGQEYGINMIHVGRQFISADIGLMYYDLCKLPTFLVRDSGLKQITLKEMMPGIDAYVAGAEMAGGFSFASLIGGTLQHELAHALDLHRGLARSDSGWEQINRDAEPYLFASGGQAIRAVLKNPELYDSNIPRPGYATRYGQLGGILEDKASVSEKLLSVFQIGELVARAANDPILKRKVEFMAGYKLDRPYLPPHDVKLTAEEKLERKPYVSFVTKQWSWSLDFSNVPVGLLDKLASDANFQMGMEYLHGRKLVVKYGFGTPLTDQEYKDAGFASRCYWSKWSEDSNGRIWLDAEYYNALLRMDNIEFTEEAGKTKRKITPNPSII